MSEEEKQDLQVGIMFGKESGDAIIRLQMPGFSRDMSVRSAKLMAQTVLDAADQALLEETLVKFLMHLKVDPDKIPEAVGAFRQERLRRDPRNPNKEPTV